MKRSLVSVALVLAVVFGSSACFRGPGSGLANFAVGALVAAAIISATPPPPPRVVVIPEPRPGFVWQAGYWSMQDGQWLWVEGRWVAENPGFQWVPAHWEQQGDGNWRLVPGQWMPVQ